MSYTVIEYPALIYKNEQKNIFIANCIIKKLIGYGQTEQAAIINLESTLKNLNTDYEIKVRPIYRFLTELN